MLIIPAIDLQQGQCVRLQQGQFDRVCVYDSKPEQLVQKYAKQGASYIHIVDLDGAKAGKMQQLDLIKSIQQQSMQFGTIKIQVGGGIRSIASSKSCLSSGIARLVIGSIAISDPALTLEIIAQVGVENIVLAFDVNIVASIPKLAIHGWQTTTAVNLWDVITHYQKVGILNVLCTDIACDGMMSGPNFSLYEEAVMRFPNIYWQASGGIRDSCDIKKLATTGIYAAILGRTLYESDFDLAACIAEISKC